MVVHSRDRRQCSAKCPFKSLVFDRVAAQSYRLFDWPSDHLAAHWAQESEVAPVIAACWERAEFPFELVPKLAKLGLGGATLKGNGCAGQSILSAVRMRPMGGCRHPNLPRKSSPHKPQKWLMRVDRIATRGVSVGVLRA